MFLTPKPHPFLPVLLFTLFSCYNTGGISAQKGIFDFIFSPCRCRCGVPNREARFIGGEYLRAYEMPWIALVQAHKDSDPARTTSIPGALINNRYIITSASPIVGLTPHFVKVSLGVYNRCASETSSANVSVQDIFIHPDYSAENKANDIALLRLTAPVHIERRVAPICLPVPGATYLGQVASVVGWPKSSVTNTTCRPKKMGLPVLDEETCSQTTPAPHTLSADKGCIGLVDTANLICPEDAGIPIMYRSLGGVYELIGVVTDQNKCDGTSKSTSLYTRVNDHLSWIMRTTRDACYCTKT